MIVTGLTGSIGMGKTTCAGFFSAAGIPVYDADATVHELYCGEAVLPIEAAFPGSTKSGVVDRQELSRQLAANPAYYRKLEAIVHPLVRLKQDSFLERHRKQGAKIVVLDIPLLLETGGAARVDIVIVATCDADIQKKRVLMRRGMTEEKFAEILSRQMPDLEKREKADYLIDTGGTLEDTKARVHEIIADLERML